MTPVAKSAAKKPLAPKSPISKSPGSKSPRKRSPRKQAKMVVPVLHIDTDSIEDCSDYEQVSIMIDEIPPAESRIGLSVFKNVDFWLTKAYEASNLNQLDAAIDFYRHGLRVDGNNPIIYYNIGALFSIKNQCKKAIRCFEQAEKILEHYLQIDFEFIEKYMFLLENCTINIGLMKYRLKQYQDALNLLQKNESNLETITLTNMASSAYDSGPKAMLSNTYFIQALCYKQLKDYPSSNKCYK